MATNEVGSVIGVGLLALALASGCSSQKPIGAPGTGGSGAAGGGGAGGVVTGDGGAGGQAGAPSVLMPAQEDDLSIWAASLLVATAADGRAVVAARKADGAIVVYGSDPEAGAPVGAVRRWTPPVEIEPPLGGPGQLTTGFDRVITTLYALEIADTGEAWFVYTRLVGPLRNAGSATRIYLRHRAPGSSHRAWDAAELVAEIGVGVVTDPTPPRVRMARAPNGALVVAWSQRGELPGLRARNADGVWGDIEKLDTDPRSMDQASLVGLAIDADGTPNAAWMRGTEREIGSRIGGRWVLQESTPSAFVSQSVTTPGGEMWLFGVTATAITVERYSRAVGAVHSEIALLTSDFTPLHMAADDAGHASVAYAPVPPPLDGPITGLRVTTLAPGASWSAPRELAPSSMLLNGGAADWDDGEATILWSEWDGTRSLLRYLHLSQPEPITLAEFGESVFVSAFSSRGQPLMVLARSSPFGGADFTVRWVR